MQYNENLCDAPCRSMLQCIAMHRICKACVVGVCTVCPANYFISTGPRLAHSGEMNTCLSNLSSPAIQVDLPTINRSYEHRQQRIPLECRVEEPDEFHKTNKEIDSHMLKFISLFHLNNEYHHYNHHSTYLALKSSLTFS